MKKAPPSDDREHAGNELSYGIQKGLVSPHSFPLFLDIPSCIPSLTFNASIHPLFPPSFSSLHSPYIEMIMVQKPIHLLSSPSTYHRRHPSAPPAVLVQPTRTPGLLSLSKPPSVTPPRSQQQQQIHHNHHNRQPRSTHSKTKPTGTARQSPPSPTAAQPQPSEDLNKLAPSTRPTTKSQVVPGILSPTPEKPPRGRQSSKQGKDKSKPR